MTDQPERCEFCGHPLAVVWVHGHGQCSICHTNVAPCCDGATCTDSDSDDDSER